MPVCIYCRTTKDDAEMSVEHILPQSLGGKFAPPRYISRCACRACNNTLGQYVDSSFSKAVFIDGWLTSNVLDCFDPESKTPAPLTCMGCSNIRLPGMSEDEVVEVYVGPFGESVYWVRPDDKELYWLSGGNPVRSKQLPTRAYFIFSERSERNFEVTLRAFNAAFSRKKTRKVFATTVDLDPALLGFSAADDLDAERIEVLWRSIKAKSQRLRRSINVNFDQRFLCKTARGVAYTFLGERALFGDYSEEIQAGLWPVSGGTDPNIRAVGFAPTFGDKPPSPLGMKHAVILTVLASPGGLGVTLTVGDRLHASILAATRNMLTEEDFHKVGHGISAVMYPAMNTSIELPLPELVLHRTGHSHPVLKTVENEIKRRGSYFTRLAAEDREKRDIKIGPLPPNVLEEEPEEVDGAP